jgi:hypothetical protein
MATASGFIGGGIFLSFLSRSLTAQKWTTLNLKGLCMSTQQLKTLDDAMSWADKNCDRESVDRLRSRQAVKILADEVRKLRMGEFI